MLTSVLRFMRRILTRRTFRWGIHIDLTVIDYENGQPYIQTKRVAAETYARDSQLEDLLLMMQMIGLSTSSLDGVRPGENNSTYPHGKTVEHALLPPGPSEKCCW